MLQYGAAKNAPCKIWHITFGFVRHLAGAFLTGPGLQQTWQDRKQLPGLFHRDRFGQVPGLIYITPPGQGNIIGKKLQRNHIQAGLQQRMGRRNRENMIGSFLRLLSHGFQGQAQDVRPRAFTSLTLDMVLSNRVGMVATATTRVPRSMREMGPCFSSPAA